MFQCLIGSLQTLKLRDVQGFLQKFQCLIGSLQTQLLEPLTPEEPGFQCLIGSLQTDQTDVQVSGGIDSFNAS